MYRNLFLCATVASMLALSRGAKNPSLDEPFQNSFARLPHAPCVTLFYRNGRVGCGTVDRDVQTGRLQYYNANAKFPAYDDPYVLVLDEFALTTSAMDTIVGNNKYGLLKGVLVLNATGDDTYLSPAPQSPQGKNTPSANLNSDNSGYVWNSNGDGLDIVDLYGVPMAYIQDSDLASYIRNTSLASQKEDSIVAEFSYYMGPDSDSHTCLGWHDHADKVWRPKCLPLGGTSVWAVAGSPEVVNERRQLEDGSSPRPVVMVTASMDASSMFHDITPGANTAASNILTLLMAAKLLGTVSDTILDILPKRVLFALFQGEAYGFVGSRAFLRDVAYPGFQCDDGFTVPSVMKSKNDSKTEQACLHPMRPSLEFQKLGTISGMINVDQLGILSTDNTLYVHSDGSQFSQFLLKTLQASITDDFFVYEADSGKYIPPTPLTSLRDLSDGDVGGIVLSGYNAAFASASYYHSHKDSIYHQTIDLEAIASAATLTARAALAAAYDDGSLDSDTAAQYAINLISDLSSEDDTLVALSNCLLKDGRCDMFYKYGRVEQYNDRDRTGIDLGAGMPLGTPPNYYVSVYDLSNGQPFVQVDSAWYGSYTGQDYGKKDTDAVAMRPTLLEMSIHGMLNDFLGRGFNTTDGSDPSSNLKSCSSNKDCSRVTYCAEDGDKVVCTGGKKCVCSRSHYHIALDEALEAAPNNSTGYFVVSDDDEGISALFVEPYWSSSVGVRVYRDAGGSAGNAALGAGLALAGICACTTIMIRRKMRKEKLY